MDIVMNNYYIRKNIFIFLNKGPLIKCIDCKCFCKRGNKLIKKYVNLNKKIFCFECIRNNFNCKIA